VKLLGRLGEAILRGAAFERCCRFGKKNVEDRLLEFLESSGFVEEVFLGWFGNGSRCGEMLSEVIHRLSLFYPRRLSFSNPTEPRCTLLVKRPSRSCYKRKLVSECTRTVRSSTSINMSPREVLMLLQRMTSKVQALV